ncbi:hypothetical protein MMC12_005720 [Toensbergia leucococca]|nr:hypothetical protein [Toensbergia leucococca]
MSTSYQSWDAFEVLGIEDSPVGQPHTCISHVIHGRRICQHHITSSDCARALRMLDEISWLNILTASFREHFEEIASLLLCRSFHRLEAATFVSQWLEEVENIRANMIRLHLGDEAAQQMTVATSIAKEADGTMRATVASKVTEAIQATQHTETSATMMAINAVKNRACEEIQQTITAAFEQIDTLGANQPIANMAKLQIESSTTVVVNNMMSQLYTRGRNPNPANHTPTTPTPPPSPSPSLTPSQVLPPTPSPPVPSSSHHRHNPTPSLATPEPNKCPICYQDINSQSSVTVLGCKHRFCSDCINPWFATQDRAEQRRSCPVCRACNCYSCWAAGVMGLRSGGGHGYR